MEPWGAVHESDDVHCSLQFVDLKRFNQVAILQVLCVMLFAYKRIAATQSDIQVFVVFGLFVGLRVLKVTMYMGQALIMLGSRHALRISCKSQSFTIARSD